MPIFKQSVTLPEIFEHLASPTIPCLILSQSVLMLSIICLHLSSWCNKYVHLQLNASVGQISKLELNYPNLSMPLGSFYVNRRWKKYDFLPHLGWAHCTATTESWGCQMYVSSKTHRYINCHCLPLPTSRHTHIQVLISRISPRNAKNNKQKINQKQKPLSIMY